MSTVERHGRPAGNGGAPPPPPHPQPVVLPGRDGTPGIAGVLHRPPPGRARDTGVLLVGPWGWDEVASHRSRREWACALAAAGYPALRIDLPGTGDSAGTPTDPGLVPAWTAAVRTATGWLRRTAGRRRVAVVGLGLGGLLAGRASADGARIDDLVRWGCPASGRAAVRRLRATARLEGTAGGDDGHGGLVAGGFRMTAQTLEALTALDRDAQAGRDLELEDEDAWAALVEHPERTRLSPPVVARVQAWLDRGAAKGADDVPADVGPAVLYARIGDGAGGVAAFREEPFTVDDGPAGRIAAVLTRPALAPPTGVCIVFLNAGAVRRIGPDRLWTEAARRWAGRGVPALRVDVHGVGESDGALAGDDGAIPTAAFYAPAVGAQVDRVLDALTAAGHGPCFVLVGLCAGGHWAFQRAVDPRVTGAVVLNAGALSWDPHAQGRRELQRLRRLTEPGWWAKLASGSVDVRTARLRAAGAAAVAPRRSAGALPTPDEVLDTLQRQGTPVLLGFSAGEPLADDLARDGLLGRLHRWPLLQLASLPGDDHTLRSGAAQQEAHQLVDRGVSRALAHGV